MVGEQGILGTSLRAVREGLLWMVPCLMVSSVVLFLASILEFFQGGATPFTQALYSLHAAINEALPLLLTASIAYMVAMQWKLPRPPLALLCIIYLVIVKSLIRDDQALLIFYLLISIVTPLYAIPLIARLHRIKWLKITDQAAAGNNVRDSLNLVMPSVIVGAFIVAVNLFLNDAVALLDVSLPIYLDYANEPTLFGVVFAALNSLFWFVGIHGYYALLPLVSGLEEAVTLNYATVIAGGEGVYPMNLSFMGAFVFIGGSGATMSLILAILLFSRTDIMRVIAIASIPIALINVNELLLFGLPIIFNPRLFIPFFLAPIANVIVGLSAIQMGLVDSPSVSAPFNSPVLLNAWIATRGDWGAVALQLVNVFVGMVIYLPFVLKLDQLRISRSIYFSSLDTTFSRRLEEAETLAEDPISEAKSATLATERMDSYLKRISAYEFTMEYQPQVARHSQHVVGSEALIRAIDSSGTVKYPGEFLPWLEKAGMMKEIDLWAVKTVTAQALKWQGQGVDIPISVNITAETLASLKTVNRIVNIVKPAAHLVHVEITEESLLIDEVIIKQAFTLLHNAGIKVFIDDFGTGFSSLSYLNRYDIDAIKIDRSFVLALENERGQKVFNSLLSVAKALALNVVVEGVEESEQLHFVPLESTISVQGWYYAKSLSPEHFVEFVQTYNQPPEARHLS
ncbi:EAL domain-containing protein [Thaumasiovibrio subtropicus]|uniref:EAL domain-containing protein n=1 Tax=Thaumasiovibrio subtropicus TaxID=1891207 RepID=UPI000B35AC17|nr:EAL domain-containing protein [Thaumasiovibrio subtropicus]